MHEVVAFRYVVSQLVLQRRVSCDLLGPAELVHANTALCAGPGDTCHEADVAARTNLEPLSYVYSARIICRCVSLRKTFVLKKGWGQTKLQELKDRTFHIPGEYKMA